MKTLITSAAVIVAIQIVTFSSASSEDMRAISFLPKNHPLMSQANIWVKTVNSQVKKAIKINYVGGSEVIPRYQQPEAVRNGVIDIIFNVSASYQAIIPEASAFILSKLSPTGERASGFYDYMVKKHAAKLNALFIGRWQMGNFYFWTKKQVKIISDLKGLKLRTGSVFNRTMKKLGVVPVKISSSETYTALERGVVDGFAYPVIGPRKKGWLKKVKFMIDAPLFGSSNATILMNLKKWNGLSAEAKKGINAITKSFEPKMVTHFTEGANKELTEILSSEGVKRAGLSNEQKAKFTKLAYDVEWSHLASKIPNEISKLKRLTGN
jgi:TRAP-type C4-dicarboxylate transport system substrate-binding protein